MSATQNSTGILPRTLTRSVSESSRRPRKTDPVTSNMVIAILHHEEGHPSLLEGFLREHQEQS